VMMLVIDDDPATFIVVVVAFDHHGRSQMSGHMRVPRRRGYPHGEGQANRHNEANSSEREPRHPDCLTHAATKDNAVSEAAHPSKGQPCPHSDLRVPDGGNASGRGSQVC
jgi:hypothetical protein